MSSDNEANRIAWPAAHRAALLLLIAVDAPDASLDGSFIPGPEYSADGLTRLLQIFQDLDVSASTIWTSTSLAAYPTLVRSAAAHGHEVALALAPGENGDMLAERARHLAASEIAGAMVTGQIGSGAIARSLFPGCRWIATGLSGNNAVVLSHGDNDTIVSIPLSPYWNDIAWLHPDRPQPPSTFLEVISTALGSVRAEGELMTIVLHPHIIGRPGFADVLVRFLDEVIASGDVWIARADQLAEWAHVSREATSP